MIITKDFVFIHMPKTGGTFVHGVFKKIIKDLKRDHWFIWYLNRMQYKLGISFPIYQKLSDVDYQEYPGDSVKGQHAGVAFIPKAYSGLPVVSVKRNPVEKFSSAYYFKWWERFPSLSLEKLNRIFPAYPNLTVEDYFQLSYIHVMKFYFKESYRDDIGILSWQFIRMYSSNAMYVYQNITQENYKQIIKDYFHEVNFLSMDNLSFEMKNLLGNTSFSKYKDYFSTKERIYPPGSSPEKNRDVIPNDLKQRIKEREWILYNYFPEYKS